MKNTLKNEDSPAYQSTYLRTPSDDDIIRRALEILNERMTHNRHPITAPETAKLYLKLRLAPLEREEFHVVFLDAQHQVIACDCMFQGTLTQTSVYPREVVKAALKYNAAALLLAHNHPSGQCEPSSADKLLTEALKQALAIVDVKVLDHFIVAGTDVLSFAERGLI